MSTGFCRRRFPNLSAPNINEASSRDIAASLHRNVLSWGVWWGQEEKESLSLRAITPSVCSHTADRGSCSGDTNLFRAASVPDVTGRSWTSAFSSITFGARKVLPSLSTSRETVFPSGPNRPVKISTQQKLPQLIRRGPWSTPMCTKHVSNSQPDLCRQILTSEAPADFREGDSPVDELAAKDQEKSEAQFLRHGLSKAERDRTPHVKDGSSRNVSLQPFYQSCIYRQVPVLSYRSVLFLDKSLSLSIVDLERRRATEDEGKETLYTSTCSFRFGVTSSCRSSADSKSAKTNEAHRRPRAAMLGRNKCNGQGSSLVHCRGLLIKQRGCKVEQIAPAHGVNNKAGDSDTQCHSATSGLLSFTGPSPSNTKAARQKGNADEAAFPTRSNFRHRQHTFKSGPVDIRTRRHQAVSDKEQEQEEHLCNAEPQTVPALDETCYYHASLKADFLEETPKILSLKEALELFRPDFISRSQSRVRRLEQRAERRRALQDSKPDRARGLRDDPARQRRNCTTPHPLSDNLFKPRERSISGREMQQRSRRIYNKLPEVTKKKEEEKKRAVSQTNRLRAEVFKKRLLDQILQR